jgi:exopolyphosphatase / guanosine-5'-triphosphate,3'-diphosphate pyrophosphatase
MIAEEIAGVPWLDEIAGRSIYAVGGTWRSLARTCIEGTGWPLRVIDNFTMGREEARRQLKGLAKLAKKKKKKRKLATVADNGAAAQRAEALPHGAMVLLALLDSTSAENVVFSGFGMREGQMLQCLPVTLRDQDPLLSGCLSQAERTGRFSSHGDDILEWMSPLFPEEAPRERRLRLAACLLSDLGWNEHPDYKAENAFHRVLRLPFAGLSHEDRAWLALTTFVRYGGGLTDDLVKSVRRMVTKKQRGRAEAVGLSLRLAHTLSGGAPGLLPLTGLEVDSGQVHLVIPGEQDVFSSAAVERRFGTFARCLDLKPVIDWS